ncbi:MAG: glycosyltransferase family 4 protein [Patescibacteria group bacterium]|nr:glycosyltransferase family 4 protein [Patescibacteria group bacterium]
MKILLATPTYPPEIGGPSQYAKNLAEKLRERGTKTEVVSYNNLKESPRPFKFFIYFLNLFKKAKNSQIIYTFNLISCGLPAFFCSKILRKKFLIRLGGDFLWERAVELGNIKKTLREYYREPKSIMEKFWLYLMEIVLNSANKIIFTSNLQKEIYKKYFCIKEEKTIVLSNPFPEYKPLSYRLPTVNYQILYAGRLIKLKNLEILIETFARVMEKTNIAITLKLIGEGPERESLELRIKDLGLENKVIIEKSIPHFALLKEIEKSYFCILPSLTEISPNFALECIRLMKPILLTKETGIYEDFKTNLTFINPQDEKDIREKILYLLDEKNYQSYIERMKDIPTSYSWNNVTEKHISLFKTLT